MRAAVDQILKNDRNMFSQIERYGEKDQWQMSSFAEAEHSFWSETEELTLDDPILDTEDLAVILRS